MKLIEGKKGDVTSAPSFLLPLAYLRLQQLPGVQHFAIETKKMGKIKLIVHEKPAHLQHPLKMRIKMWMKTNPLVFLRLKDLEHFGAGHRDAVTKRRCSDRFQTRRTLFCSLNNSRKDIFDSW